MLSPRRAAAARGWDNSTNTTTTPSKAYPSVTPSNATAAQGTTMHAVGGFDAPPPATHYMAAPNRAMQTTPKGKSAAPRAAPQTPPTNRVGTPPSTPQTPSQLEPSLITSSPRIQKKQSKLSKLRGVQSASKLMFSPPYSKTLKPSSMQNTKMPNPDDMDLDAEMSPVKKRLQYNLALHGHKDQKFDEYDENEFDPWRFIASLNVHLLPAPTKTCLPVKTCTRPTLVLDLDETLVHCSTDPGEIKNPHFVFSVDFYGQTFKVTAKRRPGLEEFLEHVKDKFEVVIFTASQKVYADKVLDIIDPKREATKHRVFRDDCVNVDGNYLKDLRVLGRDLRRTVIVDNSPQAFSFQIDNGLPILSWFDNEDDTELYKVIRVLDRLAVADDMRPILRSRFKLHQKVQAKTQRI